MTKEQKIAMARIISDMIKADNIIEENEIKTMRELMMDYAITQDEIGSSRKIRFSDAVNELKDLSARDRMAFVENIYRLAMSDRVCVPREALLLIALQYCLIDIDRRDGSGRKIPNPFLVSCVSGEATFNDQYIVYLEEKYDKERNLELERHFMLLVTISRLSGFNFIYIPKMVEEFQKMKEKYVLDVIKYMAPNLNDEYIKDVYDRLCEMTTEVFFRNVFCERLQVKVPRNLPPSVLINIGTSVVPYCSATGPIQYYTEFLCIPILSDIPSLIDEVLTFYQNRVSLHQTITLNGRKGQFKYFGFYKALFDFLVAPPPVAPDLIFLGETRVGRYQVAFKFSENNILYLKLSPSEYEVYLAIAQKTYLGNKKGLPVTSRKGLKPIISHLKNKII